MNNTTLLLTSDQYPYNLTVVGINYNNYTIRVVYSNLHNNKFKDDCSSIPSRRDCLDYMLWYYGLEIVTRIGEDGLFGWRKFKTYPISEYILFIRCQNKSAIVPVRTDEEKKKKLNTSYKDIHHKLTTGFQLSWLQYASSNAESCYIDKKSNNKVACVDDDCIDRRGILLILCRLRYYHIRDFLRKIHQVYGE
uniref:Uncharacterized protein n=1 Tax=Cannabis sativa TaxID=3483 RepID=A0A803Q974_CANSA